MSFFRKLHLIAMSALMIYSLSLCAQTEERNVDLSTVRLDGISIGDNIDAVMDSNYTKTNRFPINACLLYTSPSPRDRQKSRMPSSA